MKRYLLLPALIFLVATAQVREPIRLANNPALSPDGKMLAFDLERRHLGRAFGRRRGPAVDSECRRRMHAEVLARRQGDRLRQRPRRHAAGLRHARRRAARRSSSPSTRRATRCRSGPPTASHCWSAPAATTTGGTPNASSRSTPQQRIAEQLLFDDYGSDGTLSPDGKQLLFTREGPEWWRKGYTGSQASQIWLYDVDSEAVHAVLIADEHGSPLAAVAARRQGLLLLSSTPERLQPAEHRHWRRTSDRPTEVALTKFDRTTRCVFPCISRDGSTIVFRHLFDLYRLQPGASRAASKIDICRDDDRPADRIDRRTLRRATGVAFTDDGLEIAFIAGGDLWVMDTELREPRQVTKHRRGRARAVFSPGRPGDAVRQRRGRQDRHLEGRRGDAKKSWWQNNNFKLEQAHERRRGRRRALSFSPDGTKLAYVSGRGDLMDRRCRRQEPEDA